MGVGVVRMADVLLIHTINFPRLAIAPEQQDTHPLGWFAVRC
jgi:hypothetical protein